MASAHEAYALADELERVLPPSHRGLAHRLRLAAETAGGLYMASQTRRLIARALCASSASGDDAAS